MNQRPSLLKPVGPESLADEDEFQLGDILVRPSLLEVRAGADREALEPRVMQVLVALASARGMVVSRDELIRQCWGGRTVSEDAINRCVARLRRLAENTPGPTFEIETIPRVGYRLLPSQTASPPQPPEFPDAPEKVIATAEASADQVRPGHRPASGKRIWLVVGIGLVVAAVIFVGMFATSRLADRRKPDASTQITAAVLPFTALYADKNAQLFADQISSAVADTLGRTELNVISPAASFQFRGNAKARAAQTLHADILIDGDVKRAGDAVTVSVRVEDVASGLILLSKEIQGPVSRAADLPDLVSTFVAGAVGSDVSIKALNSGGSPRVRGEMLRAFFQCPYRQDPLCAYEIAQNLARTAPGNAMAQTMLAVETTNVLFLLPEREKPPAIAAARKAAWTAIRLDPHFGDAYIALSELAPNAAATESLLRRGLSVDPDSPSLAGYMSGFLIGVGRSHEAFTVIQKIADRYSFQQFVPLTQIWTLLQLGQTDDAIEIARRGQRLWPERGLFVLLLFEATVLDDNQVKTGTLMNDPVIGPRLHDAPSAPTIRDVVQALHTRRAADIEAVSRDCAHESSSNWPHEQICFISLVILGRLDDVFRLPLDESIRNLLFFPQMAQLRTDSRFSGLVEKLGLFSYWRTTRTLPDFCTTERISVCHALAQSERVRNSASPRQQ